MKKISILFLALTCVLTSCKKEPKLAYKYADKENVFLCSDADMDLINEATYAFEDFILTNYDFRNTGSLETAYTNYMKRVEDNLTPMAERFDPHMIAIVNALKSEKGMWSETEDITLNYNTDVMTCATNNFTDEGIKKVFSSMLSSNTFKNTLVAPIIRRNANQLIENKALATYVALDMFYAKVLDIDFTVPREEISKQIIEKNKQGHDGHNH